ncbi:MAG: AAA family ATPase [Candidatus Thiodiazotropha taylori]|nr:AAA family ATPase [Candidatus Thiodiazotropha endolucinida]MCG8084867.1 AAA family ATPase [Candidatus Thiodiazotropha taylori]MCW4228005.1 AAA family ATPase [Candidatus Thiodiazotropha taylori]
MSYIKKVKLQNFKKFTSFETELDPSLNILVGENEAGKSSILSAINLVLSGSRHQVETIGLDKLFNVDVIDNFLSSDKNYEDLPVLYAELYLDEQNNPDLKGNNNSNREYCDGMILECLPDDSLSTEIKEILEQEQSNFPYEYYAIRFLTFSGEVYSNYKKYVRHILLDHSQMSEEYATKEYIQDMYSAYVENEAEKNKHQNEYRNLKTQYTAQQLADINQRVDDYSFSLRNDRKSNLFTDLTLVQESIPIDSKGRGNQCFIKTEFALRKAEGAKNKIDIALIEEPENHLSHINMKKLIGKIDEADDKQLIVATHSNLISARLDLRNLILLHTNSINPILLSELSEETAKFFIKAPNHGILDFILSKKVLLVEGNAEYILMEKMYEQETGGKLEDSDIHVFSVGGTSFKRYLDIAILLDMKVAVLRDNDGDLQKNCVEAYEGYIGDNIQVFSDVNDARYTFEVCIYQDNTEKCDELFTTPKRQVPIQQYMLDNKTDSAYGLLVDDGEINIPQYIKDTLLWLSA